MSRLMLVVTVLLLAACSSAPPEIAIDLDECRFCRMIISDARFAAAAETSTGRTVRFDSIECLAGWVLAEDQLPRAVWVTDASRPGTLVPAAEARYSRDGKISSPMGMGWIAMVDADAAAISWDSLLVVVRAEGALPSHAGDEVQ